LDEFQILPNHVHAIIFINNIVGAKHSHNKIEFDSQIAKKKTSPLPPQYPSSHPIGTKLEKLGETWMGVVYKAHDVTLDRYGDKYNKIE
jgi:hypothetical protein